MMLPRLAVCAIAIPLFVGCDQVKGRLGSQDQSCDVAEKPKAFKSVHDDAYLTCRTLWPEKLKAMDGEPWLSRMLFNPDPVAFSARQGLAAAGGPLSLACDDRLVRKQDVLLLSQYRKASAAFFRTYFSASVKGTDDGMMVLIAGLAPADAGERVVIGAMNAFKIPTEKVSPERAQRGEFTQLLKAAFFYNVAADRVTTETRYRRKHGRLGCKPADAAFVREQHVRMKSILDEVKPGVMTEAQQQVYEAVIEASGNLVRSIS
jgi:hypothetical protein